MHVMFEVLLVPGAHVEELLSAETRDDTKAHLLTRAEVDETGFVGLEPDDGELRHFIVVRRIHERRIQNALDANPEVRGFRLHDFDL